MNRWKRSTGTALLVLMVIAAPAWAAASDPARQPVPISAPIPAPDEVMQPILISAPVSPPGAVRADLALPDAIVIDGRSISYDQGPVVSDGVLMLPLRAIVEGAGGQVTWDGETRTVTVRLGDRMAYFVIGQDAAEMNQDNVRYIQRNMIRMAKAPVIAGSRTLVSADALTGVLGMLAESGTTGMLSLIAPAAPVTPDAGNATSATIKQVATTDKGTRILVEDGVMSNGEGNLVWYTITDQTEITVTKDGNSSPGTVADLVAGKHVTVTAAGPLLMSYPAQGAAASVTVPD